MTILAETYLGNQATNSALQQQVAQARQAEALLEVYLQTDDRAKGRIHAHSTTGVELGIIKSREQFLSTGDVFITNLGQLLLIHLHTQTVMVLSFNGDVMGHAIDLIYLGHVLGNHHWPILVQGDRIYLEMVADPAVMEATVKNINIPGLCIDYEVRSPDAPLQFSPHTHH
ncbi:urease accessory protein UreE [Leptolyngbya sp. FACHB-541]|uniref:urease accessory protein UreE n=1 Tax=Leptolyngbya sp. FACHB-541 TaxID=2692810 RepID=UPI001688ACBA|nr:urease accessory protein UreE [Leptolyngbya sp. FACHB-541]MBD2001029.1 urease accessory protein UreE [Leptolyngbya sp. FACHB-541]